MYAMCGKLVARDGQREKFVEILQRAADVVGMRPGCRLYAVAEDLSDDISIWVMEIWDDKESHDASLQDERVRALIGEAMPLMDGPPDGAQLRVVGGHGLANLSSV